MPGANIARNTSTNDYIYSLCEEKNRAIEEGYDL
jgi:hypothetical protein